MNFNKLFMGIVVIPLTFKGSWILESYSKIPSNTVSFSKDGMSIKVKNSANPIIYSFDKPKMLKSFEINGEFKGLPKILEISQQGKKGYDDYPLRFGLILNGEKKLSYIQKVFAPEWIKKIYANIPDHSGLNYIQFYNVTQSPAQLNTSRIHPASELLHESFFAYVKDPGKFTYKVNLDSPRLVSGIWLSIDGDDTHSEYEVDISKLELDE